MIVFIFYLFWFLLAKPIQASQILFTDDFSSNSLDDWTVVRNKQYHHPDQPCFNNGEPAKWEIIDGQLGISIRGGACTTEIVPNDLDLTETNNYEFEFKWSFPISTHMDRNMLIKWQDDQNWYGLHIVDNKLLIQKVINGQLASLYDNWAYFPFEPNKQYSFKISFQDSLIKIWIDDQLILSTPDRSPFLSNYATLGFQASVGSIYQSSSLFDDLVVRSLDLINGKELDVALYKQNDPEWNSQEYDSANTWSQSEPGIDRWGCALTSAVMILNYYDINRLPSGEEINPASLNDWLQDQPDGYVGEGLVNWIAITRLTKAMSQSLDTPTLEYKWRAGNIENAIDEIDQGRPIILQIDGHFLVADGYENLGESLLIKDPAYNYETFSQHQTELLSIRSFTPSHTDLSQLLIVYDPEVTVTLIDESGQFLPQLKIYLEYLQGFSLTSPNQTQVKAIQNLTKPLAGSYLLKIENKQDDASKIEIYAYDVDGNVSILTQEISGTKSFKLNFNSTTSSSLTAIFDEAVNKFFSLKNLLKTLYEAGEITVKYAYLKLDQLASYAQSDQNNQDRYSDLIVKTTQELKEFVPVSTIINNLTDSN